MKRNVEYKDAALQHLRGNWSDPIVATSISIIISVAINSITNVDPDPFSPLTLTLPFVGFVLSVFIILPLEYGFSLTFLDYIRGDKENLCNKIFQGFNTYWRTIGVQLLRKLYIFLWTLCLIIPGIIKSYAYGMTTYISRDHPDLNADACIDLSETMMKGHKAQLFWLHLSFIGWAILCIFTLGVGFLWLIPYMKCSIAHFYEDVKAEYESKFVNA